MKGKGMLFGMLVLLNVASSNTADGVYICVSKTASKYHFDRDCRGLAQYTHKIEKVSLRKAKEMGYKDLCGWED